LPEVCNEDDDKESASPIAVEAATAWLAGIGTLLHLNQAHHTAVRRNRPLLDLQKRFVNLRFGMFLLGFKPS
jgi:hypothetical protein